MAKRATKKVIKICFIILLIALAVFAINAVKNSPTESNEDKARIIGEQEIKDLELNIQNAPLSRYASLSQKDRLLYKEILNSINSFDTFSCADNKYGLKTADHILDIYNNYILADFPQIFWVDKEPTYHVVGDTNAMAFDFNNHYSYEEAVIYKNALDKMIAETINQASFDKNTSDYDKALWCYEWIIENIKASSDNSVIPTNTVLSAVINKSADSEGMSKLYQYMLKACGIDSTIVFGEIAKNGSTHFWNMISIDNTCANVDIYIAKQNNQRYEYFCQTNKAVEKTRIFKNIENIMLPECTSDKLSYYKMKGLYVEKISKEEIKAKIITAGNMGNNPIQIEFKNQEDLNKAVDMLSDSEFLMDALGGIDKDKNIVRIQNVNLFYSNTSNILSIKF